MSSSLVRTMRLGIFGKFLVLMIATGIAISMLLGLYWRNIAHPQVRRAGTGHPLPEEAGEVGVGGRALRVRGEQVS